MTRINTNVSSLVAQKTLARSNEQLQQSLLRLSTGLKINVGKDDPAGLIASEVLRSDIISVQRAVSNSQRANQLISTADSALNQVSSLLNDVRGLVSEAANTGALSEEQVAANQLQIDSSLEAIDRISQTTSFQGRRLLDGSLDFITTSSGTGDVKAVGTFGATDDVAASAVKAGTVGTVTFTAKTKGTSYNGYTIAFNSGATAGSETLTVTAVGGSATLTFTVTDGTTAAKIVDLVSANSAASALFSATATVAGALGTFTGATTAGGINGNKIIITAAAGGADYNNLKIILNTGASAGSETAAYTTATNTLTITKNDSSSAAQIRSAINTQGTFTAQLTGNGLGTYSAGTTESITANGALSGISDLSIDQANFGTASSINVTITVDNQATQANLVYSGGTLTSDLILEVGGKNGFDVFNFGSGTTTSQIATALNLVSDATGISASVNGSELNLKSTEYGSNSFVSARALSGSFATYSGGNAAARATGTDVDLRVNGIKAVGDGLKASVNTSTLDLSFSVNSALSNSSSVNFSITGGGATFQLGPDVISNQQARLGIQGVSTATLGGISGTLFELRSGGAKALGTDVQGAAAVIDEVISKVTNLRGRLGAFQKTTLETNIFTLGDTLENLTDAESSIRDADFAVESARLTRAQILVQSGTSVLQIANQNPQNVLALLR